MADPKDKDVESKEDQPTFTPEQLATPPAGFPFEVPEPHGKGKAEAERKEAERKEAEQHKPASRR